MSLYKDEVDAAFRKFAAQNGARWKAELRKAWLYGEYCRCTSSIHEAAVLQRIRNDPDFGPNYLKEFKL